MVYTIWVSAECNLKCRYCYEGLNKPSLIMDKKVAEDVVKFIDRDFHESEGMLREKLQIEFHGGEPFLNTDIIKFFIKEIKEVVKNDDLKPVFVVATNATIINDDVIDLMASEFSDVTLSIDGMKKTHDFYRPFKNGAGSYDIVIKNSLKVLEKIHNPRIRMTFNSDTVNSVAEDVIHLLDSGFKIIVPIPDLWDERWDNCHIDVLEQQIGLIKEYIKDKKDVAVGLCEPMNYYKKAKCSGGVGGKVIYADGSIFPCIISGGIEEFKIGDIWTGVNSEKVKDLLKFSNMKNECCDGCMVEASCDGCRCKIINKIITGNFNQPPVMRCAIMNLFYRINGMRSI